MLFCCSTWYVIVRSPLLKFLKENDFSLFDHASCWWRCFLPDSYQNYQHRFVSWCDVDAHWTPFHTLEFIVGDDGVWCCSCRGRCYHCFVVTFCWWMKISFQEGIDTIAVDRWEWMWVCVCVHVIMAGWFVIFYLHSKLVFQLDDI